MLRKEEKESSFDQIIRLIDVKVTLSEREGEGHSDDLLGTTVDTEGVGVCSGAGRLAVGGACEESLDFAVGVPDVFCCLAAR